MMCKQLSLKKKRAEQSHLSATRWKLRKTPERII